MNENKMDFQVRRQVVDLLKSVLSQQIKLPKEQINEKSLFEEYGIDSISALKMTGTLEETFGALSKTLFFEYQTISEMADYIMDDLHDVAANVFSNVSDMGQSKEAIPLLPTGKVHRGVLNQEIPGKNVPAEEKAYGVTARKIVAERQIASDDIAVIGLALRCPEADNADEFWKNLCEKKDCISQIPKERFDVDEYFHPDKNRKGSIYARWGGFINGVDEFDPMFFNISHKEAATLDPQNRIFLQCAHAAIEDSGYTKDNLDGDRRHVGVFAGVMYAEYPLYAAQEQQKGNLIAVGSSLASVANQVSYYCNFHGPSMSLDTMCSSSLTAVNLACNSIKLGECSVAIAGGVNLSLHPNKYLSLSHDKFLSTNGKCMSFGSNGDGFVPSEGVCVLVLKPLSKAKGDGDQIYGVIKGISVNHGGKTSGFTVPNPSAQCDIIREALEKADVDARAISYVEAHGTGTSLGDPIEVNGLTKAFRHDTKETQYCYIGSVKSNIGHCESAAGVMGMAKVLLQMKYGKLVPSIHSEALNPYIEFEKTPFKVSRDLQDWQRPVLNLDGIEKEYPRIAGVSSFGAGGSNAHLVIEEYRDVRESTDSYAADSYVILLSAKRREQLITYIKQMNRYISYHKLTDEDLPSVAYCLQTGREAMDYRLGFTVATMEELKEKIGMLENEADVMGVHFGDRWENDDKLAYLQEQADAEAEEQFGKKEYEKLLAAWVNGVNVDWGKLYESGGRPKKISLPSYPFAKEKYWFTDIKAQKRETPLNKAVSAGGAISTAGQKPGCQEVGGQPADTAKRVENEIKHIINEILEIPEDVIEIAKNFEALGFNSLSLVEFSVMLTEKFGVEMTPDMFFSYSSVKALRNYYMDEHTSKLEQYYGRQEGVAEKRASEPFEPITEDRAGVVDAGEPDNAVQVAVIGISGRFPGANNTEEFWDILIRGKEAVSQMPPERTEWKIMYEGADRGQVRRRKLGVLSEVTMFDPAFFEISPREAINMDPRQRIMLEEMWKALEDAGYSNRTVEESMGVYVGAEESNYDELINEVSITANHNAVMAARLAYFLNIRGANMTINTACSSSLVAFHQAVLSIRSGESDSAVVGGANIMAKPDNYLAMENAGMTSQDGRCYAFDSRANGMVPAEAVAAVVLKRLDKAVRDGNHIYATVEASGVNYDGRTNGLTAPSGISQTSLIENTYRRFHINPQDISYIVTHGTGTKLGDPVESNALCHAFAKYTDKKNYCALTSNKPNIGHALAASGLVSVINLVLAMKHETIPASINSEQQNNYINWEDSPFYINQCNKKWVDEEKNARYGAVSAFGMSGTNAHVVLKSYPADKRKVRKTPGHLLVFSAKNNDVLRQILRVYRHYFESREMISNEELQSVSYTLLKGRTHFKFRCAIVAKDCHEALRMIRKAESGTEDINIMFGEPEKNFEETKDMQEKILNLKEYLRKEEMEEQEYQRILREFANLYVRGYEELWHGANPGLISLPTYPFAGKSFWPMAVAEPQGKNKTLISLVPAESFANARSTNPAAQEQDKVMLRSLVPKTGAELHREQQDSLKASRTGTRQTQADQADRQAMLNELVAILAGELYVEENEIDLDNSFTELGLDSIIGVEFINKINKKYSLDMKATQLYNFVSAMEFMKYLIGLVLGGQPAAAPLQEEKDTFEELLKQIYDGNIDVDDALGKLKHC